MNIKIFFILLFFLGVACKDDPPVKHNGDTPPDTTNPLQLTVEDVSCTEAFLKLSLSTSEENRTVILKRNDSIIFSDLRLPTSDTMVIDEGLLPNKTYTYTLVFNNWDTTAQVTTMDITSSNWSYTLDTLGESGSYLVDVAIINDTLTYAVGEIHTKDTYTYDSLGNWIDPFNVAKWDGKKWELMRLKWNCRVYYPNCGPVTQLFSPATAVLVFGSDDVWIASGSVHHFNGTQWSEEGGIEGAGNANKIWGDKTAGLYFVGNNGFIAHRSVNGAWQSMGSGTMLALVDIDGGNNDLYSVGINVSRDAGVVLKYNKGIWEKIIEGVTEGTGFISQQLFKTQLYGSTDGMWIDEKGAVYTAGNYMYRYKLGQWNYMKNLPENYLGGTLGYRGYLQDIDGNTSNDIIIAGQRNTLRHFNGKTWSEIGIPFDYNSPLQWLDVEVKGNIAIAVGAIPNYRAMAIVLRRN